MPGEGDDISIAAAVVVVATVVFEEEIEVDFTSVFSLVLSSLTSRPSAEGSDFLVSAMGRSLLTADFFILYNEWGGGEQAMLWCSATSVASSRLVVEYYSYYYEYSIINCLVQ